MSGEARPCEAMVEHDKALCDRCLTFGIGVPLGDGRLLTPTNSCRGRLDPGRIVKFDDRYRLPSGDKPIEEAFPHRAVLGRTRRRPGGLTPARRVLGGGVMYDGLGENGVIWFIR